MSRKPTIQAPTTTYPTTQYSQNPSTISTRFAPANGPKPTGSTQSQSTFTLGGQNSSFVHPSSSNGGITNGNMFGV